MVKGLGADLRGYTVTLVGDERQTNEEEEEAERRGDMLWFREGEEDLDVRGDITLVVTTAYGVTDTISSSNRVSFGGPPAIGIVTTEFVEYIIIFESDKVAEALAGIVREARTLLEPSKSLTNVLFSPTISTATM